MRARAILSAVLLLAFPSFAPLPAGAVVHISGTNGVTFPSQTAGATWSATGVPSASVSLFGLWYTSGKNGITVGNGASIFQTANGGTTWSPVSAPITAVFNDVIGSRMRRPDTSRRATARSSSRRAAARSGRRPRPRLARR